MSLHEIASAIIAAAQVNDDGELVEGAEEALATLNLSLEQKVEAYHYVYAELTTQACAMKELAAYYERKAHAPKAAAERLKERLHAEMVRLDTAEISTPTCRARIQASNPAVVLNGQPIPPEYTRTKIDPDRAKMLSALKSGVPLAFATLAEAKTHLRWV